MSGLKTSVSFHLYLYPRVLLLQGLVCGPLAEQGLLQAPLLRSALPPFSPSMLKAFRMPQLGDLQPR